MFCWVVLNTFPWDNLRKNHRQEHISLLGTRYIGHGYCLVRILPDSFRKVPLQWKLCLLCTDCIDYYLSILLNHYFFHPDRLCTRFALLGLDIVLAGIPCNFPVGGHPDDPEIVLPANAKITTIVGDKSTRKGSCNNVLGICSIFSGADRFRLACSRQMHHHGNSHLPRHRLTILKRVNR